LGETDVETAFLAIGPLLATIEKEQFEKFASLLVPEAKNRASTIYDDARRRVAIMGSEALGLKMTRPLVWTGTKYAWDAPLPVPADLDTWIKEHPEKRLGLQATLGDNSLWWFGLERSADGRWLTMPFERDYAYAAKHTLAGLATLRLDMTPRAGVRVQVALEQDPGSSSVQPQVTIVNDSDSSFFFAQGDLELSVDGSIRPAFLFPHSSASVEVKPGATETAAGNGWVWELKSPTSESTVLSYTPSDPSSEKHTWSVQSPS